MGTMDDEIVLTNLPTHEEEEQQQNSVNSLEEADPIPNAPNQAISTLVTKKFAIKHSKLKLSYVSVLENDVFCC
jgi:hypothetical protein